MPIGFFDVSENSGQSSRVSPCPTRDGMDLKGWVHADSAETANQT
jgi:hypothetical protein